MERPDAPNLRQPAPVHAHFDLVRHERLEIHAPGFAVLEVLRPISTMPRAR
ncbi:MAG: hypothetical protein WAM03_00310 [Pseudolabrys sp.]|jgi:hypothetical protein